MQQIQWLDEQSRQRILKEVETYLDVTVLGSEKKSVWSKWLSTGSDYSKELHHIITRNIDLYQKRKARNISAVTTAARWATFGAESIVVQNTVSAYSCVNKNYEKALQAVPIEERQGMQQMKAFRDSVIESLVQFTGYDRVRALRAESSNIDQLIDNLTSGESLSVFKIQDELYTKYQKQLEAQKLDRNWLDAQVAEAMTDAKNARAKLAHVIRHRLHRTQEKYLKASAGLAEHAYGKYLTTVAAVGAAASIDAAIENRFAVREAISTELEQATHGRIDIEKPAADIEILHTVTDYEPHTHVLNDVIEFVEDQISATKEQRAEYGTSQEEGIPLTQEEIDQSAQEYWTTEGIEESFTVEEALDPETEIIAMTPRILSEEYVIKKGDSLWSMATKQADAYREYAQDPSLTIPQIIATIQRENGLNAKHVFHPGDKIQLLQIAPETVVIDTDALEHTAEQQEKIDSEKYIRAAQAVEHGNPSADYLPGVSKEYLHDLPKGEFVLALGNRYSRGNSTPEHYSDVKILYHNEDGSMMVGKPNQSPEDRLTLDEFLQHDKHAIVRVFQREGEPAKLQSEHLQPEHWSEHNRVLTEQWKREPIRVLDADDTKANCAKHIARTFNKMADGLAIELGIQSVDAKGGVSTVSAPMLAEALIARGGRELASLKEYFIGMEIGNAQPTETPSESGNAYREAMHHWIQQAAQSPWELLTALYDNTKIRFIIKENSHIGGEPNSHGMLTLGREDIDTVVRSETTVQEWFAKQQHVSASILEQRGWLFESLGIDVIRHGETIRITNQEGWRGTTLQEGDHVIIHDVKVNHRYHIYLPEEHPELIDRSDNLITTLLVKEGKLFPVSVIEPNARVLNEALAGQHTASALPITSFHHLQPGETLGDVLKAERYPRDLYTAAQFAWELNEGLRSDRVQDGEMVPLFDPASLREELESLYAAKEQQLTEQSGEPRRIIRPGETMDALARQYGFERELYSSEEWHTIQQRLAEHLRAQTNGRIYAQEVPLSGTNRTATEYVIAADTVLHLDKEKVQELSDKVEFELFEERRAERMFIPDAVPIRTEDGIVEQAFPERIREQIDRTMGRNPELHEEVRAALALVYANEGLREVVGSDTVIGEWISYVTSRRLVKDVAWEIKDSETASAALDKLIQWTKEGVEQYPSLKPALEKLLSMEEKVAGVSSAGDFQVRAGNFIRDHESQQYAEFERALREDSQFNTDMAGKLLHVNMEILASHARAFGDLQSEDVDTRIAALVASYNGGPLKPILGSFQQELKTMAAMDGIYDVVDNAIGRGMPETQGAVIKLCNEYMNRGEMTLEDIQQANQDIQLLGRNTVAFWQSETVQKLKELYQQKVGKEMSILPRAEELELSFSKHSNYALLVSAAVQHITNYSEDMRKKSHFQPMDTQDFANARIVKAATPPSQHKAL
ncbi:MAG TPA: LysM peptidoglycan-binding domain-containing protein [Patescibacteria group bacterium]|nr:LysM peptidoglycan-binding domain-containing protein [Patescibacteria group bacterium]